MIFGLGIALLIVVQNSEVKAGTEVSGVLHEHLFIVLQSRGDVTPILGFDAEIVRRHTAWTHTCRHTDQQPTKQ